MSKANRLFGPARVRDFLQEKSFCDADGRWMYGASIVNPDVELDPSSNCHLSRPARSGR